MELEAIRYESLASTHYNVALRLCAKAASSPAGDLAKLKEEQESLREACEQGYYAKVVWGDATLRCAHMSGGPRRA